MTKDVQTTGRSPLPDIGDIIFLLVLWLLLYALPTFLFGDGSTGWHLVSGQYILHNHAIPHQDLISYSFAGAPWVAYEWLSDAIMALLVQWGGLTLLAVFLSAAIALLFMMLYEDCRRQGCHYILALVVTICGALASSIHWLARPHIFTFFGIYIFSRSLEAFRQGKISARILVAILAATTMLWVNLHPAFIFGLALIVIYIGSDLLVRIFAGEQKDRHAAMNRLKVYGAALIAACLSTFINPYGIELHKYIFKYLHASRVLAATDEFQSPVFHGGMQPSCLEFLFLLLFVGLVTSRKPPSLPLILSALAFGHLALSSSRNIPLFVIIAVPLIGGLFGSGPASIKSSFTGSVKLWEKFLSWWYRTGELFDEMESKCNMHILPALATVVLFVVACLPAGISSVIIPDVGFSADHLPTKTLEYITSHKLPYDRGFNNDNWGGYIRYKLGTPVFIDDRADFYPESFYLDYGKVNTALPDWDRVLKSHNIEWVICPKQGRLAAQLKVEPNWNLACQDNAAYLFVRTK